MSTLESLVPPLELCKQIPAGKFEDSALVWWGSHVYMRSPGDAVTPAPTLAESIMELRPKSRCKANVLGMNYNLYFDLIDNKWVSEMGGKNAVADDPATAALKLWLELNKE